MNGAIVDYDSDEKLHFLVSRSSLCSYVRPSVFRICQAQRLTTTSISSAFTYGLLFNSVHFDLTKTSVFIISRLGPRVDHVKLRLRHITRK